MKHLWEPEHPYYCSESNWLGNSLQGPSHLRYESWPSFLEDWGELDVDLNHVFRWDWHTVDEGDDYGHEEPYLQVFIMLQRKGWFRPIEIFGITPKDEPSVREWLEKHWQTTLQMWQPISGGAG